MCAKRQSAQTVLNSGKYQQYISVGNACKYKIFGNTIKTQQVLPVLHSQLCYNSLHTGDDKQQQQNTLLLSKFWEYEDISSWWADEEILC